MNYLVQLPLFFVVGFVEMFLASQRTYWISKGRSRAAALLVFFETLVAMYIIFQVVNTLHDNWLIIVAYAFGNSMGTWVNLEKVPF